jgi:hypothetical protein
LRFGLRLRQWFRLLRDDRLRDGLCCRIWDGLWDWLRLGRPGTPAIPAAEK